MATADEAVSDSAMVNNVTLHDMKVVIDDFWRMSPSGSFNAHDTGMLLGAALCDEWSNLLPLITSRTNLLDRHYIVNKPCDPLVTRVKSLFGGGEHESNPILLTTDEFLTFCAALSKTVPMYRSKGLPADLWYQLLMFCGFLVIPRTWTECEVSFPMPTNLVAGASNDAVTTRTCIYLHAQDYYYKRIDSHNDRWKARDARCLSPATLAPIARAVQTVQFARNTLLTVLSEPALTSIILRYLSSFSIP